jgi:hypothetical protein
LHDQQRLGEKRSRVADAAALIFHRRGQIHARRPKRRYQPEYHTGEHAEARNKSKHTPVERRRLAEWEQGTAPIRDDQPGHAAQCCEEHAFGQ